MRHFPKPTHKKHTLVFADDGCIDGSGLVIGTYLHGLFGNENIRYALMSHLHEKKGIEYAPQVEDLRFDGDLVYSIQICIHTDVYIYSKKTYVYRSLWRRHGVGWGSENIYTEQYIGYIVNNSLRLQVKGVIK